MNKYQDRTRTRQTFTLTGREHRGARDGNERLVCFVKDEKGLLVLWGTAGTDMRHIQEVEKVGFPVTIECDWIEPDAYQAETFGHRYWVWETDHLEIIK
jgi:hypothetical protein